MAVTASVLAVAVVETATGRTLATLATAGPPPGAAEAFLAKAPPDVVFNPEAYNPDLAVVSADNRVVAMRCCGSLEVWSLADSGPKRLATLTQDGPIHAVALSPDGKRVAYVGMNSDEGLSVWDLAAQRRTIHCPPPNEVGDVTQVNKPFSVVTMRAVTFTPDSRTVVVGGTCSYSWTDFLRQGKTARACWCGYTADGSDIMLIRGRERPGERK